MEYTIIDVPNLNDSMSRVVINGAVYYMRFQYNETGDSWYFGLFNHLQEPIVEGVRLVPNFPLNLFFGAADLPSGAFMVLSGLERIGRNDFKNGKAQFVFLPISYDEF